MILPQIPIWTSKSLKQIKNVNTKDNVLTHNGIFKPVNRVIKRKYIGDVIEIKPFEHKSVTMTPNQKIVAIKKDDNTFGWLEARDLEKGDKVIFPKIKENVDNSDLYRDILKKHDLFDHDENYYYVPIENIGLLQCNYFLYSLVVADDKSFASSVVLLAK